MRRDTRIKNKGNKILSNKIIMYSIIGVAILTVIVVSLLIYSKSLSDDVREGTMTLEQMANIANEIGNSTENAESASTEIGKSVEESKNEIKENEKNEIDNTVNTNQENIIENNTTNKINNINSTVNTKKVDNNAKATTNSKAKEETKKELSFAKPVAGEIMREYAKDNLVYSGTLEEWVTHLGIDIKADKTTVVKAAETGIVKSIKNDPRYGLTIVIEHDDGFQTIYANLLTSEFVVEGEKVEKGQSIGTVGNTAVFEIADEPHLHFELLKDSIQVDPNIYIK